MPPTHPGFLPVVAQAHVRLHALEGVQAGLVPGFADAHVQHQMFAQRLAAAQEGTPRLVFAQQQRIGLCRVAGRAGAQPQLG
ncbi:hypothetical protein G6F65_013942 [Rhizopus arrhizus]|nr:hypothetical protein G6F65_013942 [Rhizopus arrhizus]